MAALCHAEAFGRFGFIQQMDLPGMRIDRQGITAKTPNSELIAFAKPSKTWKATITSDAGQTVMLDVAPGCPRKVAASLYAPGASLFCDDGLELHLKTKKAPFLTWEQGSVAVGVPTPKLNWVLLTFDGGSAPLLLSLPADAVGSFRLGGSVGDWTLKLEDPVTGWIRAGFPFGAHELATSTAADLGQLVIRFEREREIYLTPPPTLLGLDIAADEDGVTATWNFSGPYIVPPAVALAPLGGYGVKLRTGYENTGYTTEAGPILRSTGKVLKVRFPCKHLAPGRAISLASEARPVPGTVSAIDIPSIADLAIEAMRGDRDPGCQAIADDATQTFLSGADFAMEVWSKATVSYNANNKGLDLTAAYGFLAQALNLGETRPPENPFLTSVVWRTDWLTWMPFSDTPNQDNERRAAAFVVVSSSMASEPLVRLEGAMLEAGLAGERGLQIQRHRTEEATPQPKFLESMLELRHTICGTQIPGAAATKSVDSILGSVRVLSPIPVVAKQADPGLSLSFVAESANPFKLVLFLPAESDLSADVNVKAVTAQPGVGNTVTFVITPVALGPCTVRITPIPTRPPTLPDFPAYAEVKL
jgi:hypothetical protein